MEPRLPGQISIALDFKFRRCKRRFVARLSASDCNAVFARSDEPRPLLVDVAEIPVIERELHSPALSRAQVDPHKGTESPDRDPGELWKGNVCLNDFIAIASARIGNLSFDLERLAGL